MSEVVVIVLAMVFFDPAGLRRVEIPMDPRTPVWQQAEHCVALKHQKSFTEFALVPVMTCEVKETSQ